MDRESSILYRNAGDGKLKEKKTPRREMRSLKRICHTSMYALTLIVLVGMNRLDAQVRKATISSTVADSSGAVLIGAKIEVKNLGTGIAQSAITDIGFLLSNPIYAPTQ
jgi:hypothetical protein